MNEALKDTEFSNLRDAIREMEPRAHALLRECGIENIWTAEPLLSRTTYKYRIFDLVTNNRTPDKISKDYFLDKIDEAIKRLKEIAGEGRVFVAVPKDRGDPLEDVQTAVRRVLREHDFAEQSVDNLENGVTEKTLELLEESEIFIADLVHSNPNIYFEAGYAQGIGKPIICIARKGTDITLDLRENPVIFFESTHELVRKLRERLMHLKKKRVI